MLAFHVSDMTDSGCVKAITGALHDLDAAATVKPAPWLRRCAIPASPQQKTNLKRGSNGGQ